MRITDRSVSGLFLVFGAIMVSGCAPDTVSQPPVQAPAENKVSLTTLTHTVYFATGSSAIGGTQAAALTRFLSTAEAGEGDRVTVEVVNEDMADALAAKRKIAIANMLRGMRVHVGPASVPGVARALSPDTASVQIVRYVLTSPGCSVGVGPESVDFAKQADADLGCATTVNLGLMAANPGDFLRGSPAGGADGTFAARGVQRYRAGEISTSLSSSSSGTPAGGGGGSASGSSASTSGGGN
jgi:type IV pilus biogenesis protein CpaD/CtpE